MNKYDELTAEAWAIAHEVARLNNGWNYSDEWTALAIRATKWREAVEANAATIRESSNAKVSDPARL